ncbi:MAG: hypothetical protein KKC53_01525 [Actinobacteria bacterium]|nr:hypothetical protein [Actinomycetota bacterium]
MCLVIGVQSNTTFWLYIGIRVYRYISACIGAKTWKRYVERVKIRDSFGGSMILTFKDAYSHAPFIILAITDSVLIAISFMIILLYKKE